MESFSPARASDSDSICSLERFIDEFVTITGLSPSFDAAYVGELDRLVAYLRSQSIRSFAERRKEFLGRVNWKLRLNREGLGKFYAEAVRMGVTFNYHEKCAIQRAFDLRDGDRVSNVRYYESLSPSILLTNRRA